VVFGMTGIHLLPHRAWGLIRDRGALASKEIEHLEYCQGCNDWLVTFVKQARRAGFPIAFQVPQVKSRLQEGAA
jgi:hypothetical protein